MTSFGPSSSEIIQFNDIHNSYFLLILCIGIQLLYNTVLISTIEQIRGSVICKHISLSSGFSFHLGHHKAPTRVPYAIQQAFTSYLSNAQQCIHVNLNIPVYSMPLSPLGVHILALYICISITALQISSSVLFFQIPYICINIAYMLYDMPIHMYMHI